MHARRQIVIFCLILVYYFINFVQTVLLCANLLKDRQIRKQNCYTNDIKSTKYGFSISSASADTLVRSK